jgi:hypothetical protein
MTEQRCPSCTFPLAIGEADDYGMCIVCWERVHTDEDETPADSDFMEQFSAEDAAVIRQLAPMNKAWEPTS